MRIAQVTPIYPPAIGGMGAVAKDYTEELKKLGYQVDVFTVANKLKTNTNKHIFRLRGIFHFGHAGIIPSLLWKLRNYDVIHLHYPFYGSDLFVALASLLWKVPLVTTYHMKNQSSGFLRFLFMIHKIWEWFIRLQSKVILISSIDYAESIKLKHRNLISLPFWVDSKRFNPNGKINSRKKLNIPINPVIFLFVGGLDDAHYFKGVDVLLSACSKLDNSFDWRLFIVGDGNLKYKYQKLAEELGISLKVKFVGRVSNNDLPDYYRAVDVHILPSIDTSEAFGLVTLEAGSSGTMSIVSDLPGVRTLVEDKSTGLIVVKNSEHSLMVALTWLLQHKNYMAQFGKNAREMILKKYRKDKVLQLLLDVYNEVVS